MNIPEIWHVGIGCAVGGLIVGLITGFVLTCYAVAGLRDSASKIFNAHPKGK